MGKYSKWHSQTSKLMLLHRGIQQDCDHSSKFPELFKNTNIEPQQEMFGCWWIWSHKIVFYLKVKLFKSVVQSAGHWISTQMDLTWWLKAYCTDWGRASACSLPTKFQLLPRMKKKKKNSTLIFRHFLSTHNIPFLLSITQLLCIKQLKQGGSLLTSFFQSAFIILHSTDIWSNSATSQPLCLFKAAQATFKIQSELPKGERLVGFIIFLSSHDKTLCPVCCQWRVLCQQPEGGQQRKMEIRSRTKGCWCPASLCIASSKESPELLG